MNVEQKAMDWLKGNQLSYDIWSMKYRYNNESFDEWLDRVSAGDPEIRQLIKEKKFMFGGRTTANRGTGKKASMMNCYSRGFVEDSLDDIMKANTDIAMTFKAQGGQGVSLSKLRPKGCGINHGQFKSDGIIPFMELFNRTTESISQGGSRKGALLMSLDIWHKEAPEFIKIKSELDKIQKANLSLEIDDDFMDCVKTYYETGEIITKTIHRNYNGNEVEYDVTPIELYKLMIEKAWDYGEPGCIFVDQFRNFNLMEFVDEYQIETCNPCGEQPLAKNSACDLGSINLSEFVLNPFTDDADFDWFSFRKATAAAIKALDMIIDENVNNHALDEQRDQSLKYRNVGLGVMGMYDMLIKLGIVYGSDKSKSFVDKIMNFMFKAAFKASVDLAKEKGHFPGYTHKVLAATIIRNHFSEKELEDIGAYKYGLRNCSLLSIAPTGSIGTMLNISTGCEPAFSVSYQRKTESLNNGEDTYYTVYIDVAQEYLNTVCGELPKDLFVTAGDLNWQDRIDIQSALQKHVDTAISSTVNLKHEVTLEEVEKLYLYAWEKNLKGITIFRDRCARVGILTTNTSKSSKEESPMETYDNVLPRGFILKADDNCIGKKRTLRTGCGTLHCEAFFDPDTGDLLETYFSRGSTGGCANSYTGLSRMISLAARGGVDVYSIVDQLKSSGVCPAYAVRSASHHDTSKGSSCPVAIGNALIDMYEELQAELYDDDNVVATTNAYQEDISPVSEHQEVHGTCPQCGGGLVMQGSCVCCIDCGWSKCD